MAPTPNAPSRVPIHQGGIISVHVITADAAPPDHAPGEGAPRLPEIKLSISNGFSVLRRLDATLLTRRSLFLLGSGSGSGCSSSLPWTDRFTGSTSSLPGTSAMVGGWC
ncbi:hypothetical protein VDGD_20389 [Verticillium dahliae]|nr:hypothetical protein VDGD_20389 [Verticillium dahliae]